MVFSCVYTSLTFQAVARLLSKVLVLIHFSVTSHHPSVSRDDRHVSMFFHHLKWQSYENFGQCCLWNECLCGLVYYISLISNDINYFYMLMATFSRVPNYSLDSFSLL